MKSRIVAFLKNWYGQGNHLKMLVGIANPSQKFNDYIHNMLAISAGTQF